MLLFVRYARSLFCLLWIIKLLPVRAQNSTWPIHTNGLEDVVQWDHYSIMVNDERIFLFGGEMHPWRLPVPELWLDILEKTKALGLNGLSIYTHWGFHAPTPNTTDFTNGAHDIEPVFKIARDLGLFMTVRPGPYINAETNAGGYPLWLTTGAYGSLRNTDPRYTAAWTPYLDGIAQLVAPYQVTKNGTVLLYQIENEFGKQWTNVAAKTPNEGAINYMSLLEANARANGIDVALTHNDPSSSTRSWSKDYDTVDAGGDVDIYGFDSYPSCWSCNLEECGSVKLWSLSSYYSSFQTTSPTQPSYIPEFQGGAYNPWGGPQDGCLEYINEDFVNLYYRHNIAEKVSAMSLYMLYGGTNWGWLAFPTVGTSYDYSAAISEDRSIGAKYYELKSLALFTRVSQDLRLVDRLGDGTSYTNNSAVSATELRNAATNAGFYVTRHSTSTSNDTQTFTLNVTTSLGNFTVPQKYGRIVLDGYQSKIVVTDYHFGSHTLVYSTAEVLTYAIIDGKPILVLWVPTGESGEFFVKDAAWGSVSLCNGCSNLGFYRVEGGVIVTFTQHSGLSVLELNNGIRVLIVDRTNAYRFWAPVLTDNPLAPVDETVFVQGPYLVRSADIDKSTIILTGDTNETTSIEVFAPEVVNTISWNGKKVRTSRTSYGSLQGRLAGPTAVFESTTLGPWKVQDSLPERFPNYSDSGISWVEANHTTTTSGQTTSTIPYLYVDEYGFHTGVQLWRGYFNGSATGVYLNIQGGSAFGWSAFLNGDFIGSYLGSTASEMGALTLSFENATVNEAGQNVLFIVQDNSGHDETSGALNVRGILNATLIGSTGFESWRLAGTAGGSTSTVLDPVRGVYNEGGLTAERLGWHLPGFDDSDWESSSPADGFTGTGIKFYRTNLKLDIPEDHDISLAFTFSALRVNTLRALLFVNGYQYARFNPYIGNQITYPVPPGILNYNGDNVIAVALWAQTSDGASISIKLDTQYITESSFDFKFDSSYLRPGWDAGRLQYA